MLVGVEGGKLRGEITVESDRLWTVSCKVEFGIQLLLHTRHAEQAHRGRPFPALAPSVTFENASATFSGVPCVPLSISSVEATPER